MLKLNKPIISATLMFALLSAFAASDNALPEQWDSSPANPANKKSAEFAGAFAAKALTVVTRVEKTASGQRAYVLVGGKECTVDVIDQNGKPFANYLSCAK